MCLASTCVHIGEFFLRHTMHNMPKMFRSVLIAEKLTSPISLPPDVDQLVLDMRLMFMFATFVLRRFYVMISRENVPMLYSFFNTGLIFLS